jgi:predicted double-glycine peptidase
VLALYLCYARSYDNKNAALHQTANLVTSHKRCQTDIETAIKLEGQAVLLTPEGHPNKSSCLNGLDNSYQLRFEHLGELVNRSTTKTQTRPYG